METGDVDYALDVADKRRSAKIQDTMMDLTCLGVLSDEVRRLRCIIGGAA